jgi:plastocyanin
MRRLTLMLLIIAAGSPAARAYETVAVTTPATVHGRVVLGPDLKIDRQHDTFASPALFGHRREIMRDLKVDDAGGVAGALVVVIDAQRGLPAQPRQLEILNEDLAFSPRMQVATVGSDVAMVNRDEVFHNVHAFQHGRTLFNFALPTVGTVLHHKLRRRGLISIQCDVGHEWMTAFIFVASHPYATVTDDTGHFRITGLPPGDYHLAAWHEWLGELAPVAVHVDGTVEQDLVYRPDQIVTQPGAWLLGE